MFTSAIVTPALRVQSEPRARTARHVLDELLAPHGLEAREGPGGVIQIVWADSSSQPSATTEGAAKAERRRYLGAQAARRNAPPIASSHVRPGARTIQRRETFIRHRVVR